MVFLEAMAPLGLGSPDPNSAVLQSPLEAREEAETRELRRHVSRVVHNVLLAPSPWRIQVEMLPQQTAPKQQHSSDSHIVTTQAWSTENSRYNFLLQGSAPSQHACGIAQPSSRPSDE